MTIGISKERLLKFLKEHDFDDPLNTDKALVAMLEELNPWLPIESAPKDRRILLFNDDFGVIIGQWYEEHWVSSMVMMHNVTHWQELPDDPK